MLRRLFGHRGGTPTAAAASIAAAAAAERGDAALQRGDVDAAIQAYQDALLADPRQSTVLYNLGLGLLRKDRAKQALDAFEQSLHIEPGRAKVHLALAEAARSLDELSRALDHYRRVVEASPSGRVVEASPSGRVVEASPSGRVVDVSPNAAVWTRIGKIEYLLGRAAVAAEAYREASLLDPSDAVSASNALYLSAFCDGVGSAVSSSDLAQRCFAWGARAEQAAAQRPALRPPSAHSTQADQGRDRQGEQHGLREASQGSHRQGDGRIRIGYVSPDFREHSVRFFFLPILREHDRSAFHVHCYHDREDSNDIHRLMGEISSTRGDDAWITCGGWSDDDLAQRIVDDRIDVLVDLAGHTRGNRLTMFARRLAPVQMTALGYPPTTGLASIDLKLSDAQADPPQADALYAERLVRMDNGFWCFEPPADAPDVAPAPCAAIGAEGTAGAVGPDGAASGDGRFVFGYFGEPCKLSDATLAAWSQILERLPRARLALKLATSTRSADARAAMAQRLRGAGLPMERVDMLAPTKLVAYLADYARIDAVLDTWPFAGGTTTCMALWMGAPVLTMAGDMLCSRMGASILHRVGLDDWITSDPQAYVQRAVEIAGDPQRTARLRLTLRERMARSPLTDARAWVAEYESHCRRAIAPHRA